jgi:succinate dehydrogenase hydrophobic anchor subunit
MLRTRLHLLFLFSAIVTAVVLGIHMLVQHLNNIVASGTPDPTSWSSMISRSTQGGWVAIYVLLLAFAIYHALYGLRGIILEVTTSSGIIRSINWIFIIGGILIFGWATWVLIFLVSG